MTRATVKESGRSSKAASAAKGQTDSLILAAHGRHYLAQCPDGSHVQAFPRGKKSEVAVGDLVALEQISPGQAAIRAIGPRRNLLHRSDQFRSKLLAANVDQVVIVLATEPGFSEDLLGRALVAAEALDITPLIVLNKTDLVARLDTARSRLKPYAALGYEVIEISVYKEPDAALTALWAACHGRRSILIGQSGMGKSSLLNLLIPDAAAQTREISEKLDSGKHTTTFTRLYRMPAAKLAEHAGTVSEGHPLPRDFAGELIDSPGFQEFGLYHLGDRQIAEFFPEFRPHLGNCRFYNCTHLHEPGCAILPECGTSTFSERRHALYAQLLHEMSQRLPY